MKKLLLCLFILAIPYSLFPTLSFSAGSPPPGVRQKGAVTAGQPAIFYGNNTIYDPATSGLRVSAGTNTPLPTTNFALSSKAVMLDSVMHYAAVASHDIKLCYANWQTGSTGEQLNYPNGIEWKHYVSISYMGRVYPVTWAGLPYGDTPVGSYVCSDIIDGLHFQSDTLFREFVAHVPALYIGGVGAPLASLGANGQTYYDTLAKQWYGPKSAGAWGAGSGTNPFISQGYIVPVTHYTTAAFNDYHATADDPTKLYLTGNYPRDLATWINTFATNFDPSQIRFRNAGIGYTWEGGTCSNQIYDLSALGPSTSPSCGTPATTQFNFTSGYISSSTPLSSNVTGNGYTGPLQTGCGVTTQAWAASAISGIPDVSGAAWLTTIGDSIVSGIGASDGIGDAYRRFGIYLRDLPTTIASINWAIAGTTATAWESTMTQAQAMYISAFGSASCGTLLNNAGSNDFASQVANGYLNAVEVANQTTFTYWKANMGCKHTWLATILPRVTGNQGVTGATLAAGGAGYALSSTFTAAVAGGTGTAATMTATTNGAGVVTALSAISPGSYSVNPATPNAVTGGTGTGLSVNLTFLDATDAAGQTPVNIPFGTTQTSTTDDVDVYNANVIAGTAVNNMDGYVDFSTTLRDATLVNTWATNGYRTQTGAVSTVTATGTLGNICLCTATTDYIHPSKCLMAAFAANNVFPALVP